MLAAASSVRAPHPFLLGLLRVVHLLLRLLFLVHRSCDLRRASLPLRTVGRRADLGGPPLLFRHTIRQLRRAPLLLEADVTWDRKL